MIIDFDIHLMMISLLIVAISLMILYTRGGLPLWETLLSLDNQDHISTVGAFEEPVFI